MDKGIKERERERYWESSERERTLEKRRLEQIQSRMGRASSYWKGHSKLSGSNPSAPAYPNSLSKEHTRPPLILSLSLSLSSDPTTTHFCFHTQINWIVFWRRPSCCYCFDTLTLTVVVLVGAICKTKWGFGFLLEECESVKLNQLWWFLGFQILKNIWTSFLKSKMVIIYHAFLVLKIQFQLKIKIVKLCFKNKIFTIFTF